VSQDFDTDSGPLPILEDGGESRTPDTLIRKEAVRVVSDY
jgi:hypothetical protein